MGALKPLGFQEDSCVAGMTWGLQSLEGLFRNWLLWVGDGPSATVPEWAVGHVRNRGARCLGRIPFPPPSCESGHPLWRPLGAARVMML